MITASRPTDLFSHMAMGFAIGLVCRDGTLRHAGIVQAPSPTPWGRWHMKRDLECMSSQLCLPVDS